MSSFNRKPTRMTLYEKICLVKNRRFRGEVASRKFDMRKKMSEKVSTFARSVMKLARYAHSSTVPMIDGLEKSQKSEASLPVGWHFSGALIIAFAAAVRLLRTRRIPRRARKIYEEMRESLSMALSFHRPFWRLISRDRRSTLVYEYRVIS